MAEIRRVSVWTCLAGQNNYRLTSKTLIWQIHVFAISIFARHNYAQRPYFGTSCTSITSGDGLIMMDRSVLFRSRVGHNVKIGRKALVQQSDLPDNAEIDDKTVLINNTVAGCVEW